MEANDFVSRLKADSLEKNDFNLTKLSDEFKSILGITPPNNRGLFGLNVLRTLCWNLDQAPKWRDTIDCASLLTLAIDCIRETRTLDKDDRVKTLACIFHIHKYAVRLNKSVPPELVLKISFMPFELESTHLLKDYSKTYWNILNDRISYIERLKTKTSIIKLMPKLTEDIIKVIKIYDTAQFCSKIIAYLVKKLQVLYSDKYTKELSQMYREIFTVLLEKDDIKLFKELSDKELYTVYMKLNDCVYVIAESSLQLDSKDFILDGVIRACIALVGHCTDLFFCLQTFYLNIFCPLLTKNTSVKYDEMILSNFENSLLTMDKMRCEAMHATYPYLIQLFKLYIENLITNAHKSKDSISIKIQKNCLQVILYLMKNFQKCHQISKCDNCPARSAAHDALRISMLTKNFIAVSIAQKTVLTSMFDVLKAVINEQYKILSELQEKGCVNYQSLFRKIQTDLHNTAISLNKSLYYELSINFFDVYLQNELNCAVTDHKNISRAFFNKSICELDCKLYENALTDAFLSLIYSQSEGLKTDKYMSLVLDIKSRELKSKSDDVDEADGDNVQMISVLDVCKMVMEKKLYGNMTAFISQLDFGVLLKHECDIYYKLWPSLAPVLGVARALLSLVRGPACISVLNKAKIAEILYDVMLETPSVVRTIHNVHYLTIVGEVLDYFNNVTKLSPDETVVRAALMFLKCEFNMAVISNKDGSNTSDALQPSNPEQAVSTPTFSQEHAAAAPAIIAEQLLRELLPDIARLSKSRLRSALQIYQIFVPLLMRLSRDAPALQLAHTCCRIADTLDDPESYLRNASVLLMSCPPSPTMEGVITRGAKMAARLEQWSEARLVFLCELAIHYARGGLCGVSARVLALAQADVSHALTLTTDAHLDLAVGRLLEAQNVVCNASNDLTAVNNVLKHYLSVPVTGSKWCARRYRSLQVRACVTTACLGASALCAALRAWGRARGTQAGAGAGRGAGSAARGALHLPPTDEAKTHITNFIKPILGVQTSYATRPDCTYSTLKAPEFIPKHELEPMRDVIMIKRTHGNYAWENVPSLTIPDFFHHNFKCTCFACEIPVCVILTIKTTHLEAATYSFADENDIARNYFDGVLDMIKLANARFKEIEKKYKVMYDDFVVDAIMKQLKDDFNTMQIESLVDMTFFNLKIKNFDVADEYIIDIHEIMKEMKKIDAHLRNDVLNLMTASARMKKTTKKLGLDLEEFEKLNLSPRRDENSPKTPEHRPSKPPNNEPVKIIVKDEELLKKRTLIKLKFGHDSEDEDFDKPNKSTRKTRKNAFKIPNPILAKPSLEVATPRPKRSIPKLIVTQTADETQTPNNKQVTNDFFTPSVDTPEQFFTPMSTVKTYQKKSLRLNIVKNLEQQFSTPKTEKTEGNDIKNVPDISKTNVGSEKEDSLEYTTHLKKDFDKKDLNPKIGENKPTGRVGRATSKTSEMEKHSLTVRGESSAMKEGSSKTKGNSKCLTKEELLVKSRKERLVRAVSPGKLLNEREGTRTRRVRKMNLD